MTVLVNVSESDLAIVFEREGEGPNFIAYPDPDTPKATLWLIKHYPAAAQSLQNGERPKLSRDQVLRLIAQLIQ